jgi:hypothetical protein
MTNGLAEARETGNVDKIIHATMFEEQIHDGSLIQQYTLNKHSVDFWNIGPESCRHKVVYNCPGHYPMSSILPGGPGNLLPIQTTIISVDEALGPVSISVSM